MRLGDGQEPGWPCGVGVPRRAPAVPWAALALFSADGMLCPVGASILLVHEQEVEHDVPDEDEVNPPAEGTGAGWASWLYGAT